VDPGTGLNVTAKKKVLAMPEIEAPVIQSIASHFTEPKYLLMFWNY
jgi:hypothetical protein